MRYSAGKLCNCVQKIIIFSIMFDTQKRRGSAELRSERLNSTERIKYPLIIFVNAHADLWPRLEYAYFSTSVFSFFRNPDFSDLRKHAPISFAFFLVLQVFGIYLVIMSNFDMINDVCTVLIRVAERYICSVS